MPGIFTFCEESGLGKELLTAALEVKQALPEPITALALNEADAKELATLGADKVVALQSAGSWTEGLGDAIYGVLSAAPTTVFLVGGTLRGKHLGAYVAAKLNVGMATDAKTLRVVGGKLLVSRLLYGGLALSEEEVALPAVVSIPARTFARPKASTNASTVETRKAEADSRVTISDVSHSNGTGVDISELPRLIAVGRGFRKREDLKLAEDLASALKAGLACSRPVAEEEHWLPVERYVGISGHTVKPELYLAAGISGQIQHMVGARESKVIVAINNDEHAPIFESADYGVVGDLYEVLPLLTAAVKK